MRKLLIISILAFATSSLIAQVKSADKKYNKLAYEAAIPKYERYLKKDSSNVQALERLANSYRLTGDALNAEKAYKRLSESNVSNADYCFQYAQALMQNEKYDLALQQVNRLTAMAPDDSRGTHLKEGILQQAALRANEGVYTVKKTSVNTTDSDMSPVLFNDGIVFASNRNVIEWIGTKHAWTGKQFYRLYKSKGNDQNLGSATLFATEVQTKYHDGPVCFNAAGTQMIFTRSNVEDGKRRKDSGGTTRLKLFTTQWSSGGWGIEIPFPYNSDDYSCAHPALSSDGKRLYFSSDMPGGMGGLDLYMCSWNGSSWDKPVNLGASINTKANEVFPSCFGDALYFSSNGHSGLGGLDILVSKVSGESFTAPENIGSPINSSSDDFGIVFKSDGSAGYFTSNRKLQKQNDDIYYFTKKCTNTDVLILDQESGEPLREANVRVMENGSETKVVMTDESGKFNMCLNPSSNYEFIASKNDYTENRSGLTRTQVAAAAETGTEVKVPLKKVPVVIVSLKGRVYNQDDKSGVDQQEVILLNKSTGETKSTYTDLNGNYNFDNIALNADWEVKASRKDCGEAKEAFSTNGIKSSKVITIDLPMLCKGDIIQIENIYYDYNKFNIRPDAAIELDKVVALLNKYPTMEIELRSHTDARGNDAYNAKLSDNRAKSAVEYISSKGIAKSRMIAKGYGESELLNRCKNGVECDDKEHEQNRRTEFKILKL